MNFLSGRHASQFLSSEIELGQQVTRPLQERIRDRPEPLGLLPK
jgi:hypothetical protein